MITEFTITWRAQDIQDRGRDRGLDISDTQASDILQALDRNYAESIGIGRDVIDRQTDDVVYKPHRVVISWGESPDQDIEPSTYLFSTRKELEAFVFGVESCCGWLSFEIVEMTE